MRTTADLAAIILADLIFWFTAPFFNHSLLGPSQYLLFPFWLSAKRHPQEGEKLSGLLVGFCRSDDNYIHAPNLVNFIVINFRENKLLFQPYRVIAPTIERLGADAVKIADARQRDVDELV